MSAVGVSDVDTDSDGVADCQEACDQDPLKLEPGICGCGVSDVDTDGDGTANCLDECSEDPSKVTPGICGCGSADTDSDGDGIADCNDECASDALKTTPGVCGCGVSDVDSDGDAVVDCNDGCPADPSKSAPGICGCGTADTDSDGDGVADCNDQCSLDAAKTAPGLCGCGVADTDSDSDGTPDCLEVDPECSDLDIFSIQAQLDGNGFELLDLVKASIRPIRGAQRLFSKAIVADGRMKANENWQLIWQIPSLVTQCVKSTVECVEVTYNQNLDGYWANTLALEGLVKKGVRRTRKATGNRRYGKRLLSDALKIRTASGELVGQVPVTASSCS